MRAWIVRAGVLGVREERALTNGVVGEGFSDYPELTCVPSREQLNAIGQQRHAGQPQGRMAAPCPGCGRWSALCGLVTLSQLA